GPAFMAAQLGEFAQAGLVNIVGGCCGTTPAHIGAIARAVAGRKPREIPSPPRYLRLSGLEAFTLTPEIPFVNVGERTNVTGSAKFRKLVTAGDYSAALTVARDQVENGAQVIDVNMDERKCASARRAYDILVDKVGFPPEDIIIDPNIFAIATGIEEHNGYGLAFIEAAGFIRKNLPHAHVSGGVSNLSFSFRGNEAVR